MLQPASVRFVLKRTTSALKVTAFECDLFPCHKRIRERSDPDLESVYQRYASYRRIAGFYKKSRLHAGITGKRIRYFFSDFKASAQYLVGELP